MDGSRTNAPGFSCRRAIRDDSPQARHCFTQADQVNLLVSAREADPDRGLRPHEDAAVKAK